MNPILKNQHGEGKIGCFVTLFIFAVGVAIGYKAIPIFWSNNELKDAARDMASRASVMAPAAIELQLREKAKELGIPEAAATGAMTARKSGDQNQGTCTITLRYKQKIDFYGITTYPIETDTTVSAPYINGN